MNAGHADPTAVIEAVLDAVDAGNPAINAFTARDRDRSLAEAATVRDRLNAGENLPLAGVALAVKDNIWVEGWPVTQGSKLFADHVAPQDAIAVRRARAAGAVIVGVTTCSEFACKGLTRTPAYGVTRHPMDYSLTPGGSSGGSAAAVAAGLVAAALGTDAGGSARRPAGHCGIVGFKGSIGAIPYGPGFPEPFWDLSTISPIARDVADAALMFHALIGFDAGDPASSHALEAEPDAVGSAAYSPRFGLNVPVDDDTADAVDKAVDALDTAGWTLTREDPVWPADAREDHLMPLQHAGLAALYGAAYRQRPEMFDSDIAAQIERGFQYTGADLAVALETSWKIRRAASEAFRAFDLLVGPTTPCVAWPNDRLGPDKIGGVTVPPRGHAVFTPLWNHARTPAISIPCGRGLNGLPVGLQIVGRIGADRRVLKAAAEAEAIFKNAGLWTGLERA
ncbi:MAG: amidase [Roseibium sp.]|nr:amidase [Roseibium sp.]